MRVKKHIHFIGIGGAGMSGIAEVLLNLGHVVTGSDLRSTETVRRLQRLGAQIMIGHRPRHVLPGTEVVVVSNAVPDTNPEIRQARQRGLPVLPRTRMLNDLMRLKQGLAVAGTHGKTTTTSMVAWILAQAGLDPTLVVGGTLNNIRRNARKGRGEYFVVEACEAFGSFLQLAPAVAAVTNLDDDHMEFYETRAALEDAFVEFINRVPFWGFVAINADDPGLAGIRDRLTPRQVTFGFGAGADLRATEPVASALTQHFLLSRGGRTLGRVCLSLPGRYNVINALAAATVALELRVPFRTVQQALGSFRGVRRRFERKGEVRGALVVDDYGHHPTEVAAVLTAARELRPRRVMVVFQPHLYSRTQRLYREFARALALADVVVVADVYPARERPLPGVSSQLIVDQLGIERHPHVIGPLPLSRVTTRLRREVRPGDVVVTLGAGDVWKVAENLLKTAKGEKRAPGRRT